MNTVNSFLEKLVGIFWGVPTVIVLVCFGIFLTIFLRGVQFAGFLHAIQVVLGKFKHKKGQGSISHFQALTTALSATVGLGNIAGVAVAIQSGGPGAVFWMILAGLLGMAIKFTECSASMLFRRVDKKTGKVYGGAMHYIERGLGPKWKPMGIFFSVACVLGTFGAANIFQVQQVSSIFYKNFGIPKLALGLLFSLLTFVVIVGGIARIGRVTSKLVPFMASLYFLAALVVLIFHWQMLPSLIESIFIHAFTGVAAAGGVAGIAVKEVMIQGMRRAVFSNEAGLGTSPMAHAAAQTNEPIREGVVALLEPFIDTVFICTLTALVILSSGLWNQPDLNLSGVNLTAAAFNQVIAGFGDYIVPLAVFLFAYSTLLSWSYYGEQSIHYLFGTKGILPYKIFFSLLPIVGVSFSLKLVINFTDLCIIFMLIPNLIAIGLLLPKIKKAKEDYFQRYIK